jgi:hypothetical protein
MGPVDWTGLEKSFTAEAAEAKQRGPQKHRYEFILSVHPPAWPRLANGFSSAFLWVLCVSPRFLRVLCGEAVPAFPGISC